MLLCLYNKCFEFSHKIHWSCYIIYKNLFVLHSFSVYLCVNVNSKAVSIANGEMIKDENIKAGPLTSSRSNTSECGPLISPAPTCHKPGHLPFPAPTAQRLGPLLSPASTRQRLGP